LMVSLIVCMAVLQSPQGECVEETVCRGQWLTG
jgi:hypothetical protein